MSINAATECKGSDATTRDDAGARRPVRTRRPVVKPWIRPLHDVLADYDYESIEFWEPTDEPFRRLLRVAKGSRKALRKMLAIACERTDLSVQPEDDVNVLVEKLCVAHWEQKA